MGDDRAIILGGGLVGLCTAVAMSRRGEPSVLIAERMAGEASPAAAGMLAPGLEQATGPAHEFGLAALGMYPDFLGRVWRSANVDVSLNLRGILQVAATIEDAQRLRAAEDESSVWLSADEVALLEPSLAPTAGALLHQREGAVDNVALVEALRGIVRRDPLVTLHEDRALSVRTGNEGVSVSCASGRQHRGSTVVIAAGAWSGALSGLGRRLPVKPVRGQMIAVTGLLLRHVVFGWGGYLVPRPHGETLVGSTMEDVGFDASTTTVAYDQLRAVAAAACPTVASTAVLRHWSGLRPMTPDLQPIIGRDPEFPATIYACGHSRNGILLAPLTGECVASVLCGKPPAFHLDAFSPARFDR